MPENTLYYGDNLDILRRYIADESIDLIYLDPPFKSDATYNVLFAEQNGSRSAAQIQAFEDTWEWDDAAVAAYDEVVGSGGQAAQAMVAFHSLLGPSTMLAYLSMMAPRLIELRRALKPTGSIYLHCDPTASHYLKLLMDAVFRPASFRNEIVWHYRKWPTGKYCFQRNHDVILFYSRSQERGRTFNQLYMERTASTKRRFGSAKIVSGHDEHGRRVPSGTADEDSAGVRQDDVWDIRRVPPIKQLFPTEKPAALLQRIILASSNEGDMVLDPFCGCGTTIVAAQSLRRHWVGIDITHLAIGLIRHRLQDAFGNAARYEVIGEPKDLSGARKLAGDDPYQFQFWSLGLVGARSVEQKRGADRGIDGRLFFHDEEGKKRKTKQVIFSVKSGHVTPAQVRDLRGAIEREAAEIGVFLCMKAPTKAMRREAAEAGFYRSPLGPQYPRLQILTIGELLEGKQVQRPVSGLDVTFKRAPRVKSNTDQSNLDY